MERWHLPLLGRRDIPGKLSSVELREFFSFTAFACSSCKK